MIFRKYYISALAILLIISNFSYASSAMVCMMGEDMDPCTCIHDETSPSEQTTLTKEKNSCCDSKVIELNNSNLLLKSGNSLTEKTIITASDFNIEIQDNFHHTYNKLFTQLSFHNFHTSKSDIPVFISSLLI